MTTRSTRRKRPFPVALLDDTSASGTSACSLSARTSLPEACTRSQPRRLASCSRGARAMKASSRDLFPWRTSRGPRNRRESTCRRAPARWCASPRATPRRSRWTHTVRVRLRRVQGRVRAGTHPRPAGGARQGDGSVFFGPTGGQRKTRDDAARSRQRARRDARGGKFSASRFRCVHRGLGRSRPARPIGPAALWVARQRSEPARAGSGAAAARRGRARRGVRGGWHTFVLTATGAVVGFGLNNWGQLGCLAPPTLQKTRRASMRRGSSTRYRSETSSPSRAASTTRWRSPRRARRFRSGGSRTAGSGERWTPAPKRATETRRAPFPRSVVFPGKVRIARVAAGMSHSACVDDKGTLFVFGSGDGTCSGAATTTPTRRTRRRRHHRGVQKALGPRRAEGEPGLPGGHARHGHRQAGVLSSARGGSGCLNASV